MTTTAQLRELLAKATPGPWRVADWGDSERPHMVIEGPELSKPVDHTGFWFGGQKAVDWGDEWHADNAALTVAAVNNLDALLKVVEAAEVVNRQVWDGAEPKDAYAADCALREALERLNGEGG